MMKRILFLIFMINISIAPCISVADDDMSFDDMDIVEDEGSDMSAPSVSLNPDAGVVDVKHFDISGAMLGMSYDEIYNLFFNNSSLYAPRKHNSIIYTINKEWEYNLDYECRQNNVVVPDKLQNCVYSLAKHRGLLYVSEIHLEREFTGETMDIYLTSNATDNVVWKIVYTNDADKKEGASEKFENQRGKKLSAFWQGVIDKYGMPNSDEDKWISSENGYAPMMQAFYGQLVLTDNGMNTTDASENIQKARENFQAKPYAF